MDLTWGIVGLVIAVVFLVWLYVRTVQGHSRMASNVSVKPRTRDRYDAAHSNRKPRLGEQLRHTEAERERRKKGAKR
jgi:hypothetical protein